MTNRSSPQQRLPRNPAGKEVDEARGLPTGMLPDAAGPPTSAPRPPSAAAGPPSGSTMRGGQDGSCQGSQINLHLPSPCCPEILTTIRECVSLGLQTTWVMTLVWTSALYHVVPKDLPSFPTNTVLNLSVQGHRPFRPRPVWYC